MIDLSKVAVGETLMYLVLALCIAWMLVAVIRSSRHPDSALKIEDLLLGEDGRMSKAATVMLGSFFLTSWLMVYLTSAGKMTEGYLGIYVAAWIAPTVTVLIKKG